MPNGRLFVEIMGIFHINVDLGGGEEEGNKGVKVKGNCFFPRVIVIGTGFGHGWVAVVDGVIYSSFSGS